MFVLWELTGSDSVSQNCIQLVAVRQSGYSEIYKVIRDSSSTNWVIDGDTERRWIVENPLEGGTFVIDHKTGVTLAADRSGLEACLQTQTGEVDRHGILVVAGEKVVKSISDITGERIGKAEWATESGTIQTVSIVERMGMPSVILMYRLFLYDMSRLSCSCCVHQQARDIGLFTSSFEATSFTARSTIIQSQVVEKLS